MDDNFRQLLEQVREGSEEAAYQLVDQYGDSIRRAVRRVLNQKLRSKFDSLDFVQIVWGSVFRAPDFLERIERPEDLASYLITMARNKVGMEVRRRLQTEKYNVNRETPLERAASPQPADRWREQPEPVQEAIAREKWSQLLQDQSPRCQQILRLRSEGHTCQAIAQELDVDERTVRRILKRLQRDCNV